MSKVVAYQLECKPGEYLFETPEDYEKEICKAGMMTWELHETPQPGCSPDIAVYYGTSWIQPKYVYRESDIVDKKPLYRGNVVNDPMLWPDALHIVPVTGTFH